MKRNETNVTRPHVTAAQHSSHVRFCNIATAFLSTSPSEARGLPTRPMRGRAGPNGGSNRQFSWSAGLQKPLVPQPVSARARPRAERTVAGPDAEVVGGVGVEVQLGGDTGPLQRQVHRHAVLRRADE